MLLAFMSSLLGFIRGVQLRKNATEAACRDVAVDSHQPLETMCDVVKDVRSHMTYLLQSTTSALLNISNQVHTL